MRQARRLLVLAAFAVVMLGVTAVDPGHGVPCADGCLYPSRGPGSGTTAGPGRPEDGAAALVIIGASSLAFIIIVGALRRDQ